MSYGRYSSLFEAYSDREKTISPNEAILARRNARRR
jgi:hypothetical protein